MQKLKKLWIDAEDWAKYANAYQQAYHGGDFTGNGCKRLLSKKSLDYLSDNVPIKYLPFVEVLSAFGKVVKSCYGYKLASSYKEDIASFASAYRKLKVNDTTKIHIVTEHLEEFIQMASNVLGQETGLAPFTGLLTDFTLGDSFHYINEL